MTATILYTNTDAIRAAVGLDDADVEDSVLVDQNLDIQMELALAEFLPNHEDDTIDETIEKKVKLWCMWYGALALAESPLATPKALGTGKDEYERFDIDWEALQKRARGKLDALREALTPKISDTFSIMGKSTPDYNPITGA